ncbi:DUF6963 family protein [Acuticoccus sediminis]|uniref:DUF6963 family protein n=1 Tax=Acuticoccus sediminis TaxID=2184697 RepID=UPI001CFE074C|nr:hypothetical protein [Acuticoccus sediminis]
MTIGIGAAGPRAGLAVYRALAAAERVAVGAIGGFAAFAAITADGRLVRAETQRGGSATLFTAGETTGVEPPPDVAQAPFAAVISSGPDRPVPLAQFLAADAAVGLVTGHRLPNTIGPDGRAVNAAVLAEMAGGAPAAAALSAVLSPLPDVDAGLIALGPGRGIAALDSRLVTQRPDLGAAGGGEDGAAVRILHNAIRPRLHLAPLLVEIALGVMVPAAAVGAVTVKAGTPLVLAEARRVVVGRNGAAERIETDVAAHLHGRHNCAAVPLGTPVVRDGRLLGLTTMEPDTVVENAKLISLGGRTAVAVPYAAAAGEGS